ARYRDILGHRRCCGQRRQGRAYGRIVEREVLHRGKGLGARRGQPEGARSFVSQRLKRFEPVHVAVAHIEIARRRAPAKDVLEKSLRWLRIRLYGYECPLVFLELHLLQGVSSALAVELVECPAQAA